MLVILRQLHLQCLSDEEAVTWRATSHGESRREMKINVLINK